MTSCEGIVKEAAEAIGLGAREVNGYVVGLTGKSLSQADVVNEYVKCADTFLFLENLEPLQGVYSVDNGCSFAR